MAGQKAKTKASDSIDITAVERERRTFCIVGTSPLIMNRMAEKARQQLLLGGGRKTAAEKAGVAKHNPYVEFVSAVYRTRGDDSPTVLGFPTSAFRQAMQTAALETPGAKKAQIGRLIDVPWPNLPIFGVPKIFCSITRSADANRTPDVRTRAILPVWAAEVTVGYVTPTLNVNKVATLLANAGIVAGVGDYRQEKGAGSFGSFRLASPDDEQFLRIKAEGGRAAQEAALQEPEPFDEDTAELLAWFDTESARRGLKLAA